MSDAAADQLGPLRTVLDDEFHKVADIALANGASALFFAFVLLHGPPPHMSRAEVEALATLFVKEQTPTATYRHGVKVFDATDPCPAPTTETRQ